MTDEDIKLYYLNKKIFSWNRIPNEHKEYLDKRFNDSMSYKESVWRILYNIEIRPICEICGYPVIFNGRINNIFSKTCCNDCASILKHRLGINRIYDTFKKQEIKEKTRKTKLKKYGDENYNNRNQARLTCLKKYGETSYNKTIEGKDKIKNSMITKYGVEYAACLDSNIFKTNNPQKQLDIKEKTKCTRINKYGQYMSQNNIKSLCTDNVKKKRVNSFNNTMFEKYGDITYRNYDKHKETCLIKYGVDSYSKTEEFRQLLNDHNILIQEKRNNTLRKNNTFNKSKTEEESYILLKEKYPDIIRQYKSNAYPFLCDFYIPRLDLYIECNYSWTHGFHPYDKDNKEDQIKLNKWISKKTKYYDNAIKTWTIRDVNKRNIAKENKLNYKEFFSILSLINWLHNFT